MPAFRYLLIAFVPPQKFKLHKNEIRLARITLQSCMNNSLRPAHFFEGMLFTLSRARCGSAKRECECQKLFRRYAHFFFKNVFIFRRTLRWITIPWLRFFPSVPLPRSAFEILISARLCVCDTFLIISPSYSILTISDKWDISVEVAAIWWRHCPSGCNDDGDGHAYVVQWVFS